MIFAILFFICSQDYYYFQNSTLKLDHLLNFSIKLVNEFELMKGQIVTSISINGRLNYSNWYYGGDCTGIPGIYLGSLVKGLQPQTCPIFEGLEGLEISAVFSYVCIKISKMERWLRLESQTISRECEKRL